jgi:hypothetical protein
MIETKLRDTMMQFNEVDRVIKLETGDQLCRRVPETKQEVSLRASIVHV